MMPGGMCVEECPLCAYHLRKSFSKMEVIFTSDHHAHAVCVMASNVRRTSPANLRLYHFKVWWCFQRHQTHRQHITSCAAGHSFQTPRLQSSDSQPGVVAELNWRFNCMRIYSLLYILTVLTVLFMILLWNQKRIQNATLLYGNFILFRHQRHSFMFHPMNALITLHTPSWHGTPKWESNLNRGSSFLQKVPNANNLPEGEWYSWKQIRHPALYFYFFTSVLSWALKLQYRQDVYAHNTPAGAWIVNWGPSGQAHSESVLINICLDRKAAEDRSSFLRMQPKAMRASGWTGQHVSFRSCPRCSVCDLTITKS